MLSAVRGEHYKTRENHLKFYSVTRPCAKILVLLHIVVKPTKGALILNSLCSFSFLLLPVRVINRFVSLTEMILYFDKLGQMSFIEFS